MMLAADDAVGAAAGRAGDVRGAGVSGGQEAVASPAAHRPGGAGVLPTGHRLPHQLPAPVP